MRRSIVFVWLCATSAAGAQPSHCSEEEQVIFSCKLARSRKVVSLCASQPLEKDRGSLAYRFGSIGKVELEFGGTPGSLARFRHAHDSRSQVDRTEVTFAVGQFVHTVFDHDRGNEGRRQTARGVRVADRREEAGGITYSCSADAIVHLAALEGLVPCDEDNSLGTPCDAHEP